MLEIGSSLENETFTVLIPILNDELVEPTEAFIMELFPIGSGAHIDNGRGKARIDIIDNDGMFGIAQGITKPEQNETKELKLRPSILN